MSNKKRKFQDHSSPITGYETFEVEVESDFYQIYPSFFSKLHTLSECEQLLLYCIIQHCSKANHLCMNVHLFKQFLKDRKIRTYASATYYRAVEGLKKNKIVVFTAKNYLVLNPHLVWKTTAYLRVAAIKEFEQYIREKDKETPEEPQK